MYNQQLMPQPSLHFLVQWNNALSHNSQLNNPHSLGKSFQDFAFATNTKKDINEPAKSPLLRNSTIAVPAHAPFCDPAIILRLLTYPFVKAKTGMMVRG